jgi:hypothetical protein
LIAQDVTLSQVPIPAASSAEKAMLKKFAERAANAARTGNIAGAFTVQQEIDSIVYPLFDLTPADINRFESSLVNTRSQRNLEEE